jgi:hypothetical protein
VGSPNPHAAKETAQVLHATQASGHVLQLPRWYESGNLDSDQRLDGYPLRQQRDLKGL